VPGIGTIHGCWASSHASATAPQIDPEGVAAAHELLSRNETELALEEPNHETVIENDIAFHRIIAEAAGSPVLAALIDALGGRTMRDRLRRSISQPGADETAHGEHLSILAALTAHDPERTRTRMSAHLFTVEDYLHDRPTADGTLTE
jgi:GntR family transcriptional repressor for pyruvate dehydrogenase complex